MLAELNLVEQGQGIPYTKLKYPDGQITFKIDMTRMGGHAAPESIFIKSRMNSYEDFFYILLATDALHSWGVKEVNLFVSCFLAQRSDRRFEVGQSFDLKILCNILLSHHYGRIELFQPHSDVLPALLDPVEHGKVVIKDISAYVYMSANLIEKLHGGNVTFVSPDAGAYKWVFKLSEKLKRDCISANKSRDLKTGDVTTEVHADVKGKVCLIVDDYCDGGRTFIQLATELKKQGAKAVYLYTSHGLYSRGADVLRESLDGAYTTNSINDDKHNFVTKFSII